MATHNDVARRLRYWRNRTQSMRSGGSTSVHQDQPDEYGFSNTAYCGDCEQHGDEVQDGPRKDDVFGDFMNSDEYRKRVLRKMKLYLMGEQEAELEVQVDNLVARKECENEALVFVAANVQGEAKVKVQTYVNVLLHRGAHPLTADDAGRTALHHAVRRNLQGVTQRLLEHNASPIGRDLNNATPFSIAIENNNDELGALLIAYMPSHVGRALFLCRPTEDKSDFSFQDLLHSGMQRTVEALLDCQLEECGSASLWRVQYSVLEADSDGRPPDHPGFHTTSRSALHLLAYMGNKDVIFHNVVRLLIRRKWKHFAKRRFQLNAAMYVFKLFCLIFSAVVACTVPDPLVYADPMQYARAATEALGALAIVYDLLVELHQVAKHPRDYWRDPFNLMDLSSVLCLITVIPLRVTRQVAQWYVFAIGFLLLTMRIFKYAAVFRQTGAYAQILWKIVTDDIVQFVIVFLIFLVAFSGAFLLGMRAEDNLDAAEETRNFWHTLLTGARTLIEAQPVLDYVATYGAFCITLMAVYLFTCITILLNILIAQLSDTYHNVQAEAQKGLELTRAWIVTRVELNSFLRAKVRQVKETDQHIVVVWKYRLSCYAPHEDIRDPLRTLERWSGAAPSGSLPAVRELKDQLDMQGLNVRTIKAGMARQAAALSKLSETLNAFMIGQVRSHQLRSHYSSEPPTFGPTTRRVSL